MTFVEWTESSVDYGRRLVDSAVEGARAGEDQFLSKEPLGEFLGGSAKHAVAPAVVGACLGVLGGLLGGQRSAKRAMVGGLLGGALGFGAGMLWESRELTTRVASAAWKNIRKTRDEHWFEKNPIDYA